MVVGTGTTTAGGANEITLDSANNFSTVSVVSATNATINDTNAIDLGASSVSGNLTVTAAGAITQSGALTVPGVGSFAAGAGKNITLAGAKDFGTGSIVAGDKEKPDVNSA